MGKVWQLKTKKKINNKIDKGFIFSVPSKWLTGHPDHSEIKAALEKIGKGCGDFADWDGSKYEILS